MSDFLNLKWHDVNIALLPICFFNFQKQDGKWHKTIVEIRSNNTARLPIRDVAVYDVGGEDEEFGLEFSAVCFA